MDLDLSAIVRALQTYVIVASLCNAILTFVCVSRLEGKSLPYNAFAYHQDRQGGEGLQDYCVLYRTRCYLFDMEDPYNKDSVIDLSQEFSDIFSPAGTTHSHSATIHPAAQAGAHTASDTDNLYKRIHDKIFIKQFQNVPSNQRVAPLPSHMESMGLCIELVGNRFLRQMVRRLVSTVVREAIVHNHKHVPNANILEHICHSGDRYVQQVQY